MSQDLETLPPAVERKSDRIWESFGSTDPYYGVLSADRWQGAGKSEAERLTFLATGERHIARVMATIRGRLAPDFEPRSALDFGCGVGRLVLPLARECGRAIGVDISPSMLKETAANARRAGLEDRIGLVLSDDGLTRVPGKVDLVHSYIVIQHLGTARGLAMTGQLLDRVNDGGVAALHVQYLRRESALRGLVYRARRDVPGFHALMTRIRGDGASHGRGLMKMDSTPLVPLFTALQDKGFGEVHVEFSNHGHARADFLGMFVFARRVERELW